MTATTDAHTAREVADLRGRIIRVLTGTIGDRLSASWEFSAVSRVVPCGEVSV